MSKSVSRKVRVRHAKMMVQVDRANQIEKHLRAVTEYVGWLETEAESAVEGAQRLAGAVPHPMPQFLAERIVDSMASRMDGVAKAVRAEIEAIKTIIWTINTGAES